MRADSQGLLCPILYKMEGSIALITTVREVLTPGYLSVQNFLRKHTIVTTYTVTKEKAFQALRFVNNGTKPLGICSHPCCGMVQGWGACAK
jgi:hypothetical protein